MDNKNSGMKVLQYKKIGDYIKENNITNLPRTRSVIGRACSALSAKRKVKVIRPMTGSRVASYREDIIDFVFNNYKFKYYGEK